MTKVSLILFSAIMLLFMGCSTTGSKKDMKAGDQKATESAKTETKSDAKKMEDKSKATAGKDAVFCKLKKDERIVAVNKVDSGCVVNYTKYGEQSEIATGQYGVTHCQNIKEKIVNNLTEAGFTCDK